MALFTGGSAGTLGAIKLPAPPKPATIKAQAGFTYAGNPNPGGAAKNNTAIGANAAAGATGKPVAQAAAPAAPVAAPPQAPSASGAPPPLDATATQNIANYIAGVNNKVSSLGLTQNADQTAYQNKLSAINNQEPIADLKLETGANANGGFYGSAYGQQLGNLGKSYTLERGSLSDSLNNQLGAIANSIAQLQGAIPGYEAGQAISSAGRLAAAAAANPGAGALAPAAATPAAAPIAPNPQIQAANAQRAKATSNQAKGKGTPQGGLRL